MLGVSYDNSLCIDILIYGINYHISQKILNYCSRSINKNNFIQNEGRIIRYCHNNVIKVWQNGHNYFLAILKSIKVSP